MKNIDIEAPDLHDLNNEDSGEEDNGGLVDNLPSSQIRAPAELQICSEDIDDDKPVTDKLDNTKLKWEKSADLAVMVYYDLFRKFLTMI